jgi:hypothetical protein
MRRRRRIAQTDYLNAGRGLMRDCNEDIARGLAPNVAPHPYQPKTGAPCSCRKGIQRDNCPICEGTGWRIDFAAIRSRTHDEATP